MIKFGVAACVACGLALSACGETEKGGEGPLPKGGSAGSADGGSLAGGKAGSTSGAAAGGSSAGGSASAGRSGGAGEGGFESRVPVDNRPPRPEWNPPFPVGKPGWRDSDEALCEHHQGRQDAFDVWADERGVYGVFSAVCNVLAGEPCGKQGLSLQHNDGNGWKLVYALPPQDGMGSTGSLRLTGFESGPLLLSGFLDGKTGLWQIDAKGNVMLDAELAVGRPFVVDSERAYALGDSALYRYAAGAWTALLDLPSPAQALWANEELVVVVGSDQAVYTSTDEGPFVEVAGAPAGNYSAVWAFAADDIWAGDQAGQLAHYDGQGWDSIATGSQDASGSGIEQIWGSDDGQLFFRTRTEMGRWSGSKVELLLTLPEGADPSLPRVTTSGLWGLSSKEVFLAVADKEFRRYQCGEQFMLWFDGKELHSF